MCSLEAVQRTKLEKQFKQQCYKNSITGIIENSD